MLTIEQLSALDLRGALDSCPAARAVLARLRVDAAAEVEVARLAATRAAAAAAPAIRHLGHDPAPGDIMLLGHADQLLGTRPGERYHLPLRSPIGFITPALWHELAQTIPVYERARIKASVPGTDLDDLPALLRSMGLSRSVDDAIPGVLEHITSARQIARWFAREATSPEAGALTRAKAIRRAAIHANLPDPAESAEARTAESAQRAAEKAHVALAIEADRRVGQEILAANRRAS